MTGDSFISDAEQERWDAWLNSPEMKLRRMFADARAKGWVPTRPPLYPDRKPRATIDFEGRSFLSIKTYGGWRSSRDPRTSVLCLAYRLPEWERGRTGLWHMAHPEVGIEETEPPEDLFEWIRDGGLVEAHNAFYERAMWTNIMVPRHRWPELNVERLRCSAAKASLVGLPRSLQELGLALDAPIKKDLAGKSVMLRCTRPRKPKKAEREEFPDRDLWWHEVPQDLETTWGYCRTDVLAEESASELVPDFPAEELRIWQADQRINWRGAKIDVELCTAALEVARQEKVRLNKELRELTGIESATKREDVKKWFASIGLTVPTTDKEAIDGWLERKDISGRARRVFQIVKEVNRTSTRKYQAALNRADVDDHRARDLIMFAGASTARWAGKGLQPHNFPRGSIKNKFKDGELVLDGMGFVCGEIKCGSAAWIQTLYGDVMETLSHALRGIIISDDGRVLYVADYAAVEAVVTMWLAGEQEALDLLEAGGDLYIELASEIYGFRVDKELHPKERQMGKQGILGLGFGMGPPKFVITVAKYKIIITRKFAKKVVRAYRKKYEKVRQLWYDLEQAAIETVRDGVEVQVGEHLKTRMSECGRFLEVVLPSGRALHYGEPWLEQETMFVYKAKDSEGDEENIMVHLKPPMDIEARARKIAYAKARSEGLTINPDKKPGVKKVDKLNFMAPDKAGRWAPDSTYGGKLTENVVQATARELMAKAMADIEFDDSLPYDLTLTVHDELVGEADEGQGSVKEFEHLVIRRPSWARTCPVRAEAWRATRYRK